MRISPCTRRSVHVSPCNIIYIMTGRVCTHTCTQSESQMNRVHWTGKMQKGKREPAGLVYIIYTYFYNINCWRSRVPPECALNALLLSPNSLCALYDSDSRSKNKKSLFRRDEKAISIARRRRHYNIILSVYRRICGRCRYCIERRVGLRAR